MPGRKVFGWTSTMPDYPEDLDREEDDDKDPWDEPDEFD